MPEPFTLVVPLARVRRQVGVPLTAGQIAALLDPIGFTTTTTGGTTATEAEAEAEELTVLVPTNRPDVRPAPYGIDDVIEEVARTFGYSNIPPHTPTWPQPGHLTALQRSRRLVKSVLGGLGASEGWTNTFVSEEDHRRVGLHGPAVRVSNPLLAEEPYLRRSLMPGLLGRWPKRRPAAGVHSPLSRSASCSRIPTRVGLASWSAAVRADPERVVAR